MTSKLTFRRLQPDDYKGISSLYSAVYEIQIGEQYWNWKYYQNPFGSHIIFVTLDGERIVGQTGAIPVKVKFNNRDFIACQTLDNIVLPDFKRGGTFFKLIKLQIDKACKDDLLFMYGFSVPVTFKVGTRFFRFRSVSAVNRWSFILSPASYFAKKYKIPVVSRFVGYLMSVFITMRRVRRFLKEPGGEVTEINRFDERFDNFWKEQADDYEIATVRDTTYLNWRYIDNPMKEYKIFTHVSDNKINGFIVTTVVSEEVRRGLIVDVLIDHNRKGVVESLFSAAIDFFIKEKTDTVNLWLPGHVPIVPYIEKLGFVRRDTEHNLIVRWTSHMAEHEHSDYIYNPRNWYFTMGDSDYY
jgi:hypothetical protein